MGWAIYVSSRRPGLFQIFSPFVILTLLPTPENLLLSNNRFDGQIRNAFGNWNALDFADFAQNRFTGFIPPSLFEAESLRILYLNNNLLQGPIPLNFGKPRKLRDLYLNSREIPSIPAGSLLNLSEFLLQDNQPQGITMPPSVCSLIEQDGELEDLWADCLDTDDVDCQCCTQCF